MRYPASPINIDPKITEPSASFKSEAVKVMGSILLFILVYIALMVTAIVLAIAAGYGGIAFIALRPSFLTLMVGIGLAGLGVMVLFFLVKFLFKRNKVDRSHLVEVTRQQQPDLFAFIKKLTTEIGAPFPKRIYFSSEVNASVFYNSGFWSMFLPIRKNLQIGLGLVNSLTLSEFKAVLAHEFGHFSQRSMKLGSYVYNVNHVIFNMLYDNQGYGQALESWGNLSGYFSFFANITIRIVVGIQWVLQQMYGITYMSLSRQMEFHADAVAASASGSRQLATALLKLDMANLTQEKLFQTYNNWISDNLKARNMYPHHLEVMKHFAKDFNLPVVQDLPVVDEAASQRLTTSRVVINDQWASHPSTEDRVDHLNRLNIAAENVTESAWVIFRDAEQIQQQMTDFVYRSATFKENPVLVDEQSFLERYQSEAGLYTYPEVYKGFFNNRPITEVDPDQPQVRDADSLAGVLTEETLQLPRKLEVLANDIQSLEAIRDKKNGIKTFEFNSQRYQQRQAGDILKQLQEEKDHAASALAFADKRIYALTYHAAEQRGMVDAWKEKFRAWVTNEKRSTEASAYYTDLMSIVQPIYQGQVSIGQAQSIDNQLCLNEKKGKEWIQAMLQQADALPLNAEEKETLSKFASGNFTYFQAKTGFIDENLNLCIRAMGLMQYVHGQLSARARKEYLEWQAGLLQ
jgi:Zn-dependent protease with chaperone function